MQTTLRGAIVGYGFIMEKGHVAAYRARSGGGTSPSLSMNDGDPRDVRIVAVADVSEARRRLARDQLPGVRVYADYKAMFDAEAGNLDFVDVAVPPAEHAAVAEAALTRGL